MCLCECVKGQQYLLCLKTINFRQFSFQIVHNTSTIQRREKIILISHTARLLVANILWNMLKSLLPRKVCYWLTIQCLQTRLHLLVWVQHSTSSIRENKNCKAMLTSTQTNLALVQFDTKWKKCAHTQTYKWHHEKDWSLSWNQLESWAEVVLKGVWNGPGL